MQELIEVALVVGEYFPFTQGVHEEALTAPVASLHLPATHPLHDDCDDCSLYFPKSHSEQFCAFVALLLYPFGQSLQLELAI
tara:strand:- start:76 stop:321 length:246 start_codon:yes stop_codon:yes gene_type:complete